MRRILVLLIFVLMSNGTVNANSDDRPPPYEQLYTAWGYASIDEALSEFEDHFKKELKLPLRIPPLALTHQIGIFNNMDGDINDSFEMKLVSEKYPENHYKIDVRLAENSV